MKGLLEGRDFNEWHFAFQAPWGRAGLLVAASVTVAIVVLSVLSTRSERRLARRVLLASLRAGAALCALVLFAQPAIQLENVTRLPNRVAVLVDRSASMALAEKPGAPTRTERAAGVLRDAKPALAAWRALHNVDFYTFGGPGAVE